MARRGRKDTSTLLAPSTETPPCPQDLEELCRPGGAKGPSGGQAGEQSGESQGLPCQFCHALRHLLDGRARGVAQGSPLDGQDGGPQGLAQRCTCSPNLSSQRRRGCQAAQGVPYKHQAVGGHQHPLAVRHKEARRLVGLGAAHQGRHRRLQRGEVALALACVELQQLEICSGQSQRLPWAQGLLRGKRRGQWPVLSAAPSLISFLLPSSLPSFLSSKG